MNHEPQLPDGSTAIVDVLQLVLTGCIILGILGILAGTNYVIRSRGRASYGQDAAKGNAIMVGSIIMTCAAAVVKTVLLPSLKNDNDTAAGGQATDVAPAAPTPAPANEPTDWAPLIWVGGVIGALVIAALAVHLVVRTRHRILDRRAAAETLAADFTDAKALYSQVANAYAEYLADPYAIFTRPLLDDLDEPRTAAFITAFTDAGALNTDTCPATSERVKAFTDASRTALTKWTTADTYARAIGMGVLTDDSKRTVRRIRSALDLALDDSAAAGERASAMETVQRLSNGLITVPERIYARAETAIETATRKQLTS